MTRWLKRPWLELNIMLVFAVVTYLIIFIAVTAIPTPEGGMAGGVIWGWLVGFFVISTLIALVATVGGIGGGVLFTPFILAFTPIDSLIARGTGLIVAMFSGLMATGPVCRTGLANLKMCIFLCVAFGIACFSGALGAVVVAEHLGEWGEAAIRMLLGLVIGGLILYFIFGGKKIEWPEIKKSDRITESLDLRQPFYEPSLKKVVDYGLTRMGWLFGGILFVGMGSGFFGMGAGWAIVPFQNVIAGTPLKVAAANSVVLLGMGDCVAVWPYFMMGALIPILAAPWLAGQVVGGLLGALVLVQIKAGFVRWLLIGLMGFSCWGLVTRALTMWEVIERPPHWMNGLVLLILLSFVMVNIVREFRKND